MRFSILFLSAIAIGSAGTQAAPVPVNISWGKTQPPKSFKKPLSEDCVRTFCAKNPSLGATDATIRGTFHQHAPDTSNHLTATLYDQNGHIIDGWTGKVINPQTLAPGQKTPGSFHLLPGPNQTPTNADGTVSPYQA